MCLYVKLCDKMWTVETSDLNSARSCTGVTIPGEGVAGEGVARETRLISGALPYTKSS